MGSAFSPSYAAARDRGRTPATHFPAVNIALYRPGDARWVMTERGAQDLTRTPSALSVGPSRLSWDGDELVVNFDERCATFPSPIPARLRGSVRLRPQFLDGRPVELVPGRHRWWPIAPRADAEVVLEEPQLRFEGPAYFDANAGDEPITHGFSTWNWSRLHTPSETVVTYHAEPRRSAAVALAHRYTGRGTRAPLPTILAPLPRTRWGLSRRAAVDPGQAASVLRTLEDTPFYARTLVTTELAGTRGVAVHESLDATRLTRAWVRFLLPFRSRRLRGATER